MFSRIALLAVAFLAAFHWAQAADTAKLVADEDLTVLPAEIDAVAPHEMVDRYVETLAYEALDRRKEEYEKLKTVEQLTAYQQRRREFFVQQLGGFPQRTPLNARVVGQQTRDGYKIEKVIFESQPRHYVTAVLYLPLSEPPYPGVLVPCGHSANGKGADPYQRACILLATNGIAAFCYDPIGQGERRQILVAEGERPIASTLEHTLVGVGSILLGTNTARYRIWDGMRAMDYLASRPEIDPERLGCTGNSGGGTLTSYLMALDERILCAAPSCFLTTYKRLLETIGAADAEQNIHAQISFGMDEPDYVLMRAPKPTLMCVATQDYFPIDGAWDNFRQAKRFYTRLDASERVSLIETDATHGFSTQLRVGMVRWMRRWLLGIDDAITEPDVPIMTDEEVQCTEQGQVMRIDGARSVFDINADLSKRYAAGRQELWKQQSHQQLLGKVREITGIRPLSQLPPPKVEGVGRLRRDGYEIEKLILRTEPGIALPALAFVPESSSGKQDGGGRYLYLHGEGKQVDAAPGGAIEKLVRQGNLVLAVDLRGIGETARLEGGKGWDAYFGHNWKTYFVGYLLGKSHVQMRAEDVLVCARFLAGYNPHGGDAGKGPSGVHLVGIGQAGPPALHAAVLEPQQLASLRLSRSIVSWTNVVNTPLSRNQLINVVHGALEVYDLPDLVATLPPEKVTIEQPLDAAGEPVSP